MEPIVYQGTSYYLQLNQKTGKKELVIDGDGVGFQGEMRDGSLCCPLSAENAAALRKRLPWLNTQPLGLATSFGFGDRLGLATPGHMAAVRGTKIAPIFAQQSVRENARTGRTPQIVMDDAMWTVFEQNWRLPWGADADHVKEIADLPPFIAAGYSFFTIDPNLHVDNEAHTDSMDVLENKVNRLPWPGLEITLAELRSKYLDAPVKVGALELTFSEENLYRALGKYGRAIAHIKTLSNYLVSNVEAFDLEVSVDETDTPTSVKEHYFIANELRRLKVPYVSLAPRFIGSFEKGVDYIGDMEQFNAELARHAEVMHAVGRYKLSIHTGSDKFSIYPAIAREAKGLVHVKTAGTSYLEALRVVAAVEPAFFREILDFSRGRYETDRATYHVSGKLEQVPPAEALDDDELIGLFEQFDARQVLHVTFGSVLDIYGKRLLNLLKGNGPQYQIFLETHFKRHLEAFV